MKPFPIILLLACLFPFPNQKLSAQSVGIGTQNPEASAKLDVQSTNQGFLPPRLNAFQRDAIVAPTPGLIIYCTDCKALQFYNGLSWRSLDIMGFQNLQVGNGIVGENISDESGSAVSISKDGSRVAIGAYLNSGNGANSGQTRVYEWSGTAWFQIGNDIDGESAMDYSGFAISLSQEGKILAIGAVYNDGNGSNSGHVRVYLWDGFNWTQIGNDIDGEAIDDVSGVSVSLSANGLCLAVGAVGNDGNGNNSGHVRIYNFDGTDWIQAGNDVNGEAAGDKFGGPVVLSDDGKRLAVGGTENDVNGPQTGHVRVFDWNGTDWVQLGGDLDGEAAGDYFGVSLSFSSDGNRLAVGGSNNGGNGTASGHTRVFQWSGVAWLQMGMDLNGEAANDASGSSVSLSGDGNLLAIGAPFNAGFTGDGGHVRMYNWNGTSWVWTGKDLDGPSNSGFGTSVSLSRDGSHLVVGAPYFSSNSGQTFIFR